MPKTHFTNGTIEKLPQGDWTDPRYPNLHMRVGSKARTWMMRLPKRPDGSKPGLHLGRFPDLNKEAAIRKYESERGRLARGEPHPDVDERIRELEAELRALKKSKGKFVTFGDFARDFLDNYIPKSKRPLAPNTRLKYEFYFRKHLLPRWQGLDVECIEEAEIEELLNEVKVDRPASARILHEILNTMFNWALRKRKLKKNPCTLVDTPAARGQRFRHLFPDEIVCVWEEFSKLKLVHAGALKLLLLTGQRRVEVTEMPWNEIHGDWWTLAAHRAKPRRPNLIYLTSLSQLLIEKQRSRPKKSEYVFRGDLTEDRPISLNYLSKLCRQVSKDLVEKGKISSSFTVHDLRRTMATRSRENGVSRRIVETVLNHGTRTVTDVYDLYGMKPEIQKAFTDWNDYLVDLLKLKSGEV